MPTSARKSSIGGARRGPQKAHIPYRGDNPEVGKKTGIAVQHVERKSDGFEPFEELLQQADGRTPPRPKGRKKSVAAAATPGGGDGWNRRYDDYDDEDGEMSMQLDSPVQHLVNMRPPSTPSTAGRRRSSIRPVARTSDVDFDKIPSPRPSNSTMQRSSRNSAVPGPSRLSQSTTRARSYEPDSDSGNEDAGEYDYGGDDGGGGGQESYYEDQSGYQDQDHDESQYQDQSRYEEDANDETMTQETHRRRTSTFSRIEEEQDEEEEEEDEGQEYEQSQYEDPEPPQEEENPPSPSPPPPPQKQQQQKQDKGKKKAPPPPSPPSAPSPSPPPPSPPRQYSDDGIEDDIAQGLRDVSMEEASDEEQEPEPEPQRQKKKVKMAVAEERERERREKPRTESRSKKENRPQREGVRRSKREHFAPLEWWRGERVVYGKTAHSGPVLVPQIKEIIRIPKSPPAPLGKRKRGSTRPRSRSRSRAPGGHGGNGRVEADEDVIPPALPVPNPEEGWDDDTQPICRVLAFTTMEEVERRIAWTARMVVPQKSANSTWSFNKIFGDDDFIAAGQLIIPVNGRKPSKAAKDNTYVFYVIEGAVNFKIHDTSMILTTGGMFMVPRGNNYLIENISNREARLFFTQARKVEMNPEELAAKAAHVAEIQKRKAMVRSSSAAAAPMGAGGAGGVGGGGGRQSLGPAQVNGQQRAASMAAPGRK